jgi:hypothetical protein
MVPLGVRRELGWPSQYSDCTTGRTNWVRFTAVPKIGSGVHPLPSPMDTGTLFPRIKCPGRVTDGMTCNSILPYDFMSWCVKHRDNFAFTCTWEWCALGKSHAQDCHSCVGLSTLTKPLRFEIEASVAIESPVTKEDSQSQYSVAVLLHRSWPLPSSSSVSTDDPPNQKDSLATSFNTSSSGL